MRPAAMPAGSTRPISACAMSGSTSCLQLIARLQARAAVGRQSTANTISPTSPRIRCRVAMPSCAATAWCICRLPISNARSRIFARPARCWLIATTFPEWQSNADCEDGDWRALNFERAPFNWGPPVELLNENCLEAGGGWRDKSLGVWRLGTSAMRRARLPIWPLRSHDGRVKNSVTRGDTKMITLTAKDVLPEDGASGTLVGRVWVPDLAARPWSRFATTASSMSARGFPPSARSARRPIRRTRCVAAAGRTDRRSRKHRCQHAARSPRPGKTLAAGAARPAGPESRGRHLRDLDAGARDRGAGARQSGLGGSDPQGSGAAGRRRSFKAQARLAGSDEAEAVLIEQNAWSQYLEVGIGPDAEVFTKAPTMSSVGTGHGCRPASEIDLEQSGAGSRARGVEPRRDRRCDARQRRQSARLRGTLGAAVVEGQGQQRLLRRRPAAAAVRQQFFARRRQAGWTSD